MGALALVERGKLRLDEDANLRLKSWRIPDGEFTRSERVTLRRLLSHTAGMPDIGYIGYGEGREIPTLVQVLDGVKPANTAPTRVVGPPGAKWDYSGAGYTVLQQLMIDAAGKPFPDLMRELVFDKLGMTRSTFEQPLPERFAAAAARGHQPNGARYGARWNVYPEMAAAGLWTTPSDLARFAIELQRAKRGRSRKVLSQTMATHMLTVQPAGGQPSGWGLGVALTGEGRALRFSHSGGTLSFVCNLAAYPETGQGAVVMINSRARGLYEEIFRALAAEYGWPETKP
jgi:CubicO group peptidase (beta-lactamase class C family)